ncbi:MAG: TIGR02300 family protein, partial [Pseudomonadota bacterium]|nr:TIGR02300 family protein [Pseudomonadota bacterium]
MIKVSWGTKRFCLSCSRKFFDLNRKNIECPYCGSAFSEEESLKNMLPKRGPKKSKEPVAEESVEKPEQPLGEIAGNI